MTPEQNPDFNPFMALKSLRVLGGHAAARLGSAKCGSPPNEFIAQMNGKIAVLEAQAKSDAALIEAQKEEILKLQHLRDQICSWISDEIQIEPYPETGPDFLPPEEC